MFKGLSFQNKKNMIKNKSTLLKIRKNENFTFLGTPWRKKIHTNFLFFFKFEESLIKVSKRSERKMALVVRDII